MATSFGSRLKELRTAAGLSQKDLAAQAGIGQQSIANWEQGLREPSWPNVVAIAAALGVSCEAFQQEPAPTEKPKPGRPPKATPATPPADELPAKPSAVKGGRPKKTPPKST